MLTMIEAMTAQMFHDSVCRKWRRNGMTKRWKRRPDDFRVPVKYGLYTYDAITPAIADRVHVPGSAECKHPNGRP